MSPSNATLGYLGGKAGLGVGHLPAVLSYVPCLESLYYQRRDLLI